MKTSQSNNSDNLNTLHREIEAFKTWAETLGKRTPDWEVVYPGWDNLYNAVNRVLAGVPLNEWKPEVFNQILYALARDHEAENIQDKLVDYPDKLIALAEKALSYPDYHTRWQIAHIIHKVPKKDSEIEILLNRFLSDENEYVRRRASLALEYRKSLAGKN